MAVIIIINVHVYNLLSQTTSDVDNHQQPNFYKEFATLIYEVERDRGGSGKKEEIISVCL